jgi:fructan beta-fructosidase
LSKLSGKQPVEINNITIVGEKEISIAKNHARAGNAYWLTARIICEKGVTAGFKIAQKKDKDNNTLAETVIGYDVAKQELFVDRSNAGNGKIKNDKLRQIIPLSSIGGKIKLEILLDKSSLEIFVNDGQKVLSTSVFPDKDANGLAVFSSGGKAEIQSLKVWDLSKIKGK